MNNKALGKYIELEIDPSMPNVLFLYLGSKEIFHYSYDLITEIWSATTEIKNIILTKNIEYVVIRSLNNVVWNMGGDLEFFLECQKNSKIDLLEDYAYKCIEFVYQVNLSFETDAKIISLIEGNAYGGGFECALSTGYIISEDQVKFSFPEVLFSTFPGMGAYSFLTRRIGYKKAHEIVMSGKKWTATDMYNLGVADHLVKRGEGLAHIKSMIDNHEMHESDIEKICKRVSLNELKDIVTIWVNSVLDMKDEDIRLISKIIENQKRASQAALQNT